MILKNSKIIQSVGFENTSGRRGDNDYGVGRPVV